MTPDVIKTLIISGVLLTLGMPILRLIRLGKIKGLSAGKDGIKLDMAPVDKRANTQHALDKRITGIDDDLEFANYKITSTAGKDITRMFIRDSNCMPTAHMMATDMKNVLYQALRENSFKDKLSKDTREAYVADKLESMKTVYDDMVFALSKEECTVDRTKFVFPDYSVVEKPLREVVLYWADMIRQEVTRACEKKIETYEEFKAVFMQADDKYFQAVVEDCIAKNKGYIENLK